MNATVTVATPAPCGTSAVGASYVEFYYCVDGPCNPCALLCTTAWAFALICEEQLGPMQCVNVKVLFCMGPSQANMPVVCAQPGCTRCCSWIAHKTKL